MPALTPTGMAIGLGLIFVLRPIAAWLSLVRTPLTGRRKLVVAAYGVRGVGSIYYLGYAGSHMELVNEAELWAIIAFTIVVSTVVHGFTASLAVEKATGVKQTPRARRATPRANERRRKRLTAGQP
jgi:NhaP-type Na+/H+ or K+/H+ antiporter